MALDDVMDFPASFTIKVIGSNDVDFANLVHSTIKEIADVQGEPDVRNSAKGNFVSVNQRFIAKSVEHLESVHTALNATGKVKYII